MHLPLCGRALRALLPAAVLCAALPLAACQETPKIDFDDAGRQFAARGPQPGQPLPELSLVTREGHRANLPQIAAGRPLVLVTASLTCSVAREQQTLVNQLAERYGDQIAVVIIYTIEAHPKTDPCPYTNEEWVPEANKRDNVLVRQPGTQAARMTLAAEYHTRYALGSTLLIDTMDNASWKALGAAPNLGLLVDSKGIIRAREGWFDEEAMEKSLAELGIQPLPGKPAIKKPKKS